MHIAPTGQELPIWTPRHAVEEGVGVVGILQDLHTGPRGRVPEPDGIVPPTTGQEPPIRTPRHPTKHSPAMAAQHPGWHLVGYIPDGHQRIRACTGELRAIGTPGNVVERDRVALDDAHALSALDVPHPQGLIFTATEQKTAVGREGDAIHMVGMPTQYHAITTSLNIPEPDSVIKATTGHGASIRTPGHGVYMVRMLLNRMETASTGHVPESGRPIPTRAGQLGAVGCKGQPKHPVRMPAERLHAGGWLCYLQFPYLDASVKAATGQVCAIGTPGHRIYSALGSDRLYVCAGCCIPEAVWSHHPRNWRASDHQGQRPGLRRCRYAILSKAARHSLHPTV